MVIQMMMKAAGFDYVLMFWSETSAMRQMESIIDTLVHCMHTHQILAHVILGMNQSALMSVGLLCTVGRNFSCVVPAGLLNPASHFCSNFRSRDAISST